MAIQKQSGRQAGNRYSIREAAQLYEEMRSCRKCEYVRQQGLSPFLFRPTGQRAMFLSLVPNAQAVFRPLASIRFFRAVYRALFGPSPSVTDPVSAFTRLFYWSHYHKCYFPDFFNEKKEIPPAGCKDTFLNREIKALGPGLQLIIVSGQPLVGALFNEKIEKGQLKWLKWPGLENIETVLVNFPKSGTEPEFEGIRRFLKGRLGFSEIDPNPMPIGLGVRGHDEPWSKEYVLFELDALEEYWDRTKKTNLEDDYSVSQSKNVDDFWRDTVVIPRIKRYAFIFACDSFIEDQSKAFLAFRGQIPQKDMNRAELIKEVKSKLSPARRGLLEDLSSELIRLREIRNAIAHSGGRPDYSRLERILPKNGIPSFASPELLFEPNGTLIIDDQICENFLEVTRRYVELLIVN